MRKLDKHSIHRWIARGTTSLALAASLGLGMPAGAATLYKWVGDDGSISYTDELDRIPARHRAGATRIETGGLDGYARFTPAETPQPAAGPAPFSAPIAAPLPAVSAAPPAGAPATESPAALVQVNGNTSIRVPTDTGSAANGPLIVEEIRVRRDGSNFTIHDTVVRRGDDVLMVVRPAQSNQGSPSDWVDEAELIR